MLKTEAEFGRLDQLLIHVNNRIVQKYKGFRQAFRRFDKNFDGSLNFREFMSGMYEMGINLTLPDFRLLFEKIDYDNEGEIDYFKFCLLDYDKVELREKLQTENKDYNMLQQRSNKMFAEKQDTENTRNQDQYYPKNKHQERFLEAVENKNKGRKYLEKKMMIDANFKGLKYARDLPIDHVYGVTPENAETNDLAGTMKNAYNKEAQLHFDTVDVDYKP